MMKSIKVCVVGEEGVGKSTLVSSFVNNEYKETTTKYTALTQTDNGLMEINFWVSSERDSYEERIQYYVDTDCFILCFAMNDQNSFDKIQSIWIPEIQQNTNSPVFFLAATKTDLKESKYPQKLNDIVNQTFVSRLSMHVLGRKINAIGVVEFSSKEPVCSFI
ncbi:hypothetical protein EIN_135480 [Entamoeba invadens IP1]|uniref:small monomeric GTPase n=1 Tax=Entamoeba invadens IP1 TaxID=370355 RepID=A0A0A1U313_ENTIV|nr:hypothetical protein EIN_135480 [Entamoeba invadens IP1]ELP85944.1 hypothetical protein EIN_135480 [Entamoeba invadens IP1]|eukprot:XP_004185290.1 hypothetical protein EIN_135480 [Entamoeba invadens IP1]